ncbi:MAG TPA: hypothetical protein VFR41_09390, partial [Acidimicrobiia bacterium]|nr:hypothetical protein [Acidimicrobiia bacterium]
MADDELATEEGEGEGVGAEDEGKKKGSKKKLIFMILLIVVVGYEAASMTVLKAPPLTPAQKQAKEDAARYTL